MNIPLLPVPTSPSLEALHAGFLSLLPRIQLHAKVSFRYVKCPHRREDAVAEAVALAWKWYVGATLRGKDVSTFVTTLATYAARHVKSGRRLCGQEASKDCLSSLAQTQQGFVVGKLPDFETLSDNPLMTALVDNTRSPVPDQVAFRFDFPAWLNTLSDRDKRVVEDLMMGERTLDVARKHGISPGRVSQLRREFMQGWLAFCGEREQDSTRPTV